MTIQHGYPGCLRPSLPNLTGLGVTIVRHNQGNISCLGVDHAIIREGQVEFLSG